MNIKPCMGHISGTWELLLREYWRKSMIIGEKNTDLKRLTRVTKTSLFDRNWAISLNPRRKSHPLRLVWWALIGTDWTGSCKSNYHTITVLADCSIVNLSLIIDSCYHLFYCRIFNVFNSFFVFFCNEGWSLFRGETVVIYIHLTETFFNNWFTKDTIFPRIFSLLFSIV